jgi:hypothetical protein
MKTKDIIGELMYDAEDINDEKLQILIQSLRRLGDDIKFMDLVNTVWQKGYNEGWRDAGGM